MMKTIETKQCEGEGQGVCKRCEEKGFGTGAWCWMSLLRTIILKENGKKTELEGCYCSNCVKEIEDEWRKGNMP